MRSNKAAKREKGKQQNELQEFTFHQVSKELYDNIGQLLSSSKMLINIAGTELETIPDSLITAEQTIGEAILDLRLLSKMLTKSCKRE